MGMRAVWLEQTTGPLAVEPRFIAAACNGFWNAFSLEKSLAQPRYSWEDLCPSLKECAFTSRRSELEVGEEKWREQDNIFYFNRK